MTDHEFMDTFDMAKILINVVYSERGGISYDEFSTLYDRNIDKFNLNTPENIKKSMMTKITYFNHFLVVNALNSISKTFYNNRAARQPHSIANVARSKPVLNIVR